MSSTTTENREQLDRLCGLSHLMKYKPQYLELHLPMPLEPMLVEGEKEERGFAIIIGGDEEPASGPVFPRPPGGRGFDGNFT